METVLLFQGDHALDIGDGVGVNPHLVLAIECAKNQISRRGDLRFDGIFRALRGSGLFTLLTLLSLLSLAFLCLGARFFGFFVEFFLFCDVLGEALFVFLEVFAVFFQRFIKIIPGPAPICGFGKSGL